MVRFVAPILIALISSSALADTARIATWNLGGFNAIPADNLDNIIEGLRRLDADIVVLPELNPLSHAQTIAQELSAGGECHKPAAPDQPLARQEIGFVYKCTSDVTSSELVIGSDLDKQGYRNGAVVHAKIGQFDFVLIGLHLKAGRGVANRDLRNEQLKIIRAYVQGVLMGGEKDVLVIGDYNMIPGEDDENFDLLNSEGTLRFVSSEDLAGQGSHVSNGQVRNMLDGYAFTNVDGAEYQEGTVEIVQMHQLLGLTLSEYAADVTDHLPLVADFRLRTV